MVPREVYLLTHPYSLWDCIWNCFCWGLNTFSDKIWSGQGKNHRDLEGFAMDLTNLNGIWRFLEWCGGYYWREHGNFASKQGFGMELRWLGGYPLGKTWRNSTSYLFRSFSHSNLYLHRECPIATFNCRRVIYITESIWWIKTSFFHEMVGYLTITEMGTWWKEHERI